MSDRLPMPDSAYLVVVGNPVDGFGFTGPFAGRDAAEGWIERWQKHLDGDATVAPLALPEAADPPGPDLAAELRALLSFAGLMNTRQHAGLEVRHMWGELYQLCNQARGALAAAEDIAEVVREPSREVGELRLCSNCGADVEWSGVRWRDKGNRHECGASYGGGWHRVDPLD